MTDTTILVLRGSLRAASVNRALAQIAVDTAPSTVSVEIYSGLADVPFYNEDIDGDPAPAAVADLRAATAAADAVLLVTPENNGTVPAVLKNAIDWLSRPYGNSALKDKPVAVIGASMARTGGKDAHDHARRAVTVAGGRPVESIEVNLRTSQVDDAPDEVAALVSGAVADLADVVAGAK